MKFMQFYIGIEIRNNVKIKVQNLFAITKRLKMTLSEVKVKIFQSVVQGVAELLRKLSTNLATMVKERIYSEKNFSLYLFEEFC